MKGFSERIIKWYLANKRELPWRETTVPYNIWLSEVILQQTRVNQGLSYYLKFVENYPTVAHLAAASEQEVLKLWQGLGYYSRARNLRFTALEVIEKYAGVFPGDYETLLKLKGIGPYTAAAVASFATNEKVAVVDGNVYRVLARIFGIDAAIDSAAGKKQFNLLANELIGNEAALHNQAIMEFGAIICKPKLAQCSSCIFSVECWANSQKSVDQFPVKAKKIKVTTRHFNYLVFSHDDLVYVKEREKGDVWQGLYDFPLLESTSEITDPEWIVNHADFSPWSQLQPVLQERSIVYRHLLSHREILASFWEFELNNPFTQSSHTAVNIENQVIHPLPQLIVNYLEQRKNAKRKREKE